MKKTIIITVTAFFLAITTSNAISETIYENEINATHMLVSKVSPFCMAIVKGDLETVKKMIELGADVNKKSIGMTPAMYAAKYNKVEILKLLISRGANLKARSDVGYTAKKYAEISNAVDAKMVIENTLNKSAKA